MLPVDDIELSPLLDMLLPIVGESLPESLDQNGLLRALLPLLLVFFDGCAGS